jgi:hypothetical protein
MREVEAYHSEKKEDLVVLTEKSGAVFEENQWKSSGTIVAQILKTNNWITLPVARI